MWCFCRNLLRSASLPTSSHPASSLCIHFRISICSPTLSAVCFADRALDCARVVDFSFSLFLRRLAGHWIGLVVFLGWSSLSVCHRWTVRHSAGVAESLVSASHRPQSAITGKCELICLSARINTSTGSPSSLGRSPFAYPVCAGWGMLVRVMRFRCERANRHSKTRWEDVWGH